ncbi:AAA family ATPase [Ureaplasma ceti]|uniref:ATPase AAA-type core domain-containing protein n=1 Tax=Ureaplasma ceti TaxID=3119530 RepID=A0ABP9U9H0_9BACT
MGVKFEVKNFRNIAIEPDDKPASLILDRNLEFAQTSGDLVILIGPNNCGKSNLLDALCILGTDNNLYVEPTDEPYYLEKFGEENNDEIKLSLINDAEKLKSTKRYYYKDKYTDDFERLEEYFTIILDQLFLKTKELEQDKLFLSNFKWLSGTETFATYSLKNYFDKIRSLVAHKMTVKNVVELYEVFNSVVWAERDTDRVLRSTRYEKLNINDVPEYLVEHKDDVNFRVSFKDLFDNQNLQYASKIYKIIEILDKVYKSNKAHFMWQRSYPINIFKYEDKDISKKHFIYKYGDKDNWLFRNILEFCGVKPDKLNKEKFLEAKKFWKDKLNANLKQISDEFNRLFTEKDYLYTFEVDIDMSGLTLEIFKERADEDAESQKIIPLPYDQQSTGFKWFFNLYFQLLINKGHLEPDSIILMDEPANNLCPSAIAKLRDMVKEFAIKNQVVILVTTHNPYWVDCDHLEELRILDKKRDNVKVYNNFNYDEINHHGSNTLHGAISALECFPASLLKTNVPHYVFVEGLSDYLYLTAVKTLALNDPNKTSTELKKYNQLIFLPINGVGLNKTEAKQIYQEICNEYEEKRCLFLVDADNPGLRFESVEAPGQIEIKTLAEIMEDDQVITIESLIAKEDADKFELIVQDEKGKTKWNKDVSHVYTFKRILTHEEVNKNLSISDSTKIKLFKLLDKLANYKFKELVFND